jgi:outer membrane protein assembly factor BamA
MNSRRPSRLFAGILAGLFFCASGTLAGGQAAADGATKLVNLRFTGLSHFTNEQADEVAGLRQGQMVTPGDLQSSAGRLAQSGGFASVNFKYSTNAAGMSAEFTVAEVQNLLPCVFDNFVWFSDDEIGQALRKSVPLYGGAVPEGGPSMDQISDALRALLQSKSIPGDVQRVAVAQLGGPVSAMSFRVTGVSVSIRTLSFPGANEVHDSDLQKAAAQELGRDYFVSEVETFDQVALVPVYRHEGYYRASFGVPTPKVQDSTTPGTTAVSVTIPVKEGAQYSWDAAHWSGNQAISSSDLDHLLGMTSKEIADADKIDLGLSAITKAYGTEGYIDAAINPRENIDDANLLVSYDVAVKEGVQYHMGQVTFAGVSDKDAQKLASQWQLKPGAVYNNDYALSDFMKKSSWPKPPNGKPPVIKLVLKRNPQTATVDVTLTLGGQ